MLKLNLKTTILVSGSVILSTALSFIFINYYYKRKETKKKNKYPKYTVILHQYSRGLRAPSLSPYALKLETWLRMANIPYHNVHGNRLCISYNDVYIYETDACINFLMDKLGKNIDRHLDGKQCAIAIAIKVLVEDSLKWCMAIHRFMYETDENLKQTPFGEITCKTIKSASYSQGYGRHTKEEMYAIAMADLKALNDYLSTNLFYFNNQASSLDAIVFAFISQIINHDNGPLNEYINKECPNLIRYHDHIKKSFWKDWFSVIEDKNDAKIYFYLAENF